MARAAAKPDITTEELKADLDSLREDMDQLVGDLSKIVQQGGENGVKAGKSVLEDGMAAAEEAPDQLRELIRENPLGACGAAIGAGFLGALLMRR
ncbi:MAG: hypothetical protein CMH91_09375 [Oceanicaulis sp.]|uniref:hypothetical protein n=1 Tax=unclassified Oceanicaulis TaxID=2632123 RepID=UPI000C3AA718|nr:MULTISPECIES: hypothetical protein [unclassified Oceanicaulis]MAB68078.1 hypothetical protein [Oceanicaulis sp.]MBC39257.1 hypothetical protein [Oceanicaulis sp.]HBU62761.1 hypothetical protein [Oceanicaulis sp.]HCR94406.1 hypothetical protein [Oceanicaulis sp.]|tara:strand:- start:78 stop:362 length:285 start_codon:yes stop_codon:yes gene_type:complete